MGVTEMATDHDAESAFVRALTIVLNLIWTLNDLNSENKREDWI